ncbi:MAG: hypothetical protein WA747_11950 [Steroidobacteraceae bacterium]
MSLAVERMAESAARRVACVSVLLYALALAAEVLPGWRGWRVLLSGWRESLMAGADPRVAFGWLANPLLWASWVLVFRSASGGAAVLAALAVLLGSGVHFGTRIAANGVTLSMPHLGAGYWLWLAGLLVALLAALLGLRR